SSGELVAGDLNVRRGRAAATSVDGVPPAGQKIVLDENAIIAFAGVLKERNTRCLAEGILDSIVSDGDALPAAEMLDAVGVIAGIIDRVVDVIVFDQYVGASHLNRIGPPVQIASAQRMAVADEGHAILRLFAGRGRMDA